ncbi:MAG: hypothetical protein WKF59_00840 [Chitinophagaceae bacterium]
MNVLLIFLHANSIGAKISQRLIFKFEVYNYGYMRFANDNQARTYKLLHGKDYAIIWSRRSNSWTVIAVN